MVSMDLKQTTIKEKFKVFHRPHYGKTVQGWDFSGFFLISGFFVKNELYKTAWILSEKLENDLFEGRVG